MKVVTNNGVTYNEGGLYYFHLLAEFEVNRLSVFSVIVKNRTKMFFRHFLSPQIFLLINFHILSSLGLWKWLKITN